MNSIDVLSLAWSQLGVAEKTGKNDGVPYNTWYYGREVSGDAYPWCMAFVQWVFAHAGKPLPYRTASCNALLSWYKQNKPDKVVSDPKPGDIVIFAAHTGIVDDVYANGFTTVEGNYSNKVSHVWRKYSEAQAFIRPDWDSEKKPVYNSVAECPDWARAAVQFYVDRGFVRGVNDKGDLGLDDMKVWTLVVMHRSLSV